MSNFDRLRVRARAILDAGGQTPEQIERTDRVLQELQLLQTELELQQGELLESQQRAEALRQHYFQLFDEAPIGLGRLDKLGLLVELNTAGRALLGVSQGRLPPLFFAQFVPAEADREWDAVLHPVGDEVSRAELPVRRIDGERTLVRATVSRWRGAEAGWLVTLADVSELSKARAAERASGERFAKVVELSHDGVVLIDLRTDLVRECNRAFAELLGGDVESIRGQSHRALLWPDTAVMHQLALDAAVRQKSTSLNLAYRGADGQMVPTEVSLGALKESGAQFVFLIVRNVTERLRLEAERRALSERAMQAQRLEALGQLAAGTAHEVNNLLAAVLATAEGEPVADAFTVIRQAALRGRELTSRLLTLSRKEPLRSAPFDLLAGLDQVAALVRKTFPPNIAVHVDRPAEPWIVQGDAGQWEQALLNLSLNARDSMPAGGTLRFRAAIEGELLVVSVGDTGAGMTPDVLERAFEPFFTTKRMGEGTGLGLAHVRAVVQAHRGRLSVESVVGKGTVFRLEFDASDRGQAGASVAVAPPVQAPAVASRVLVVDDDDSVRGSVVRLLARAGYAPVAAADGSAAVEVIERDGPFALVLTDRTMPVMSGETLIAEIRRRDAKLPVVLMTGTITSRETEALRAAGATAVICKPFSTQEILALLGDVLKGP